MVKYCIDDMEKPRWEDVLDSVKEGVTVCMCECAFADTDEELILMATRIKEITRKGGVVHIIK